jgi:hypothetical protein
VDDVEEDLREYEAVENVYRGLLAEAIAAGNEHRERVATLTLEHCRIMKVVIQTPPGIERSQLRLQALDLQIEKFQLQLECSGVEGGELSASLKRQALQRANQARAETVRLLETQRREQTGIP